MIEQSSHSPLLGLEFDSCLSWKERVSVVCKKVSRKLGLLKRLKHNLSSALLNAVYLSLIQSQIDYCLSIWGSCSKYLINNLQRLQNRAAHIVTNNFDYEVSPSSIIKYLKWMNIQDRCNYFTAIETYKCLNGLSASQLSTRFKYVNDIHNRTTRSALNNHLYPPKPNVEIFKSSLHYRGCMIWNSLPSSVKNASSLNSFKELYRTIL